MRFLFTIIVCFVPFFVLAKEVSKEKVIFVTHPIPLMVESETKGVFIDIIRKFFEKTDVEVEIMLLPRNRAFDYFRTKKALILFPGVGPEPLGDAYLKTVNFYEKRDYLFYRKGDHYSSMHSLKGKTVGITNGYPYAKEILETEGVHFEAAPSDEMNFTKLGKKRIDAFIVEEFSGLAALKTSGVEGIVYDKDKPLSKLPVYIAVRDCEEGKKWHRFLNEKLKEMNKNAPLMDVVRAQFNP
jgi:polar amino acid transport system substrate-binding protein